MEDMASLASTSNLERGQNYGGCPHRLCFRGFYRNFFCLSVSPSPHHWFTTHEAAASTAAKALKKGPKVVLASSSCFWCLLFVLAPTVSDTVVFCAEMGETSYLPTKVVLVPHFSHMLPSGKTKHDWSVYILQVPFLSIHARYLSHYINVTFLEGKDLSMNIWSYNFEKTFARKRCLVQDFLSLQLLQCSICHLVGSMADDSSFRTPSADFTYSMDQMPEMPTQLWCLVPIWSLPPLAT